MLSLSKLTLQLGEGVRRLFDLTFETVFLGFHFAYERLLISDLELDLVELDLLSSSLTSEGRMLFLVLIDLSQKLCVVFSGFFELPLHLAELAIQSCRVKLLFHQKFVERLLLHCVLLVHAHVEEAGSVQIAIALIEALHHHWRRSHPT